MTSFLAFSRFCQQVEAKSGSLEKQALVASFLSQLEDEALETATNFVMGNVFPEGDLGVGPSILYEALSRASGLATDKIMEILRATGDPGLVAFEAASKRRPLSLSAFTGQEHLTISEVQSRFLQIGRASGRSSRDLKVKNLQYLFSSSSPLEAQFIARLAMEDLRIGVGEGVVRDAIAQAFGQPNELVERAYHLVNDLGVVARYASKGELDQIRISLNRPIKMMLAQIGESIEASLKEGAFAVEWKFDGARVQIHKDKNKVRIFSRRLEDVTASLPEIVLAVSQKIHAESAILDGEAVAISSVGRPLPFQEILKRFRRKYEVEKLAHEIPLRLNLFDLLYLNGISLIDLPLSERRSLLSGIADTDILADQILSEDPETVKRIYKEALDAGHEGVMLKNPSSPYVPGKRGKNWLKIKPVMESLDLVVTGARWGEGRRAKLLGSFRLACIDPATNDLVDIGWVATGLSDELLTELHDLFRDLILVQDGMELGIKPRVVFEVGYEEIQKSPNYSSGYALRFPRFIAVRNDKAPEEADTLDRVEELYRLQRGRQKPANVPYNGSNNDNNSNNKSNKVIG